MPCRRPGPAGALLWTLLALFGLTAPAAFAQDQTPGPQFIQQGQFRYQVGEKGDRFGAALAAADFDGDGRADLAIAAPGQSVASLAAAGSVAVAVGDSSGLRTDVTPEILQTWDGQADSETEDWFGSTLVSGDFNGDGYADLAIGASYEDHHATDAGVVEVHYGGSDIFWIARIQDFAQDSPGLSGDPEKEDHFGWSLASGDFDGDGFDDLAIGVVGEVVEEQLFVTNSYQGAVQVLYGGAEGLAPRATNFFAQRDLSGAGDSEDSDHFGRSLAAGDFDGDGFDDLAVGVSGETWQGISHCGVVDIVFGGPGGLDRQRTQVLWQGTHPSLGTPETNDAFGYVLAAGDLNGDGRDDLAVGVPYEDVGTVRDAGAVVVAFGSAAGLSAQGLFIDQDSPGVADVPEVEDRFGWALAIADLDRNGAAELIVGVPWENGTGAVHGFLGSASGPVLATSVQLFQPGSGAPEINDLFGSSLASGDFDGNGYPDLAIGSYGEWLDGMWLVGQVDVLYSASPKLIWGGGGKVP